MEGKFLADGDGIKGNIWLPGVEKVSTPIRHASSLFD